MKKRIIPCLDIRGGRVVKGKKFKDIQDVADPIELAKRYEADDADELFLLDITGEDRAQFLEIVANITAELTIPVAVGGGIRTVDDAKEVIEAGANKVSVTSAAISQPEIIRELADLFGSEKVVLSIDAKKVESNKWHAFTAGGKNDSGLDVIQWAQQGETLGAGEILLNSIDTDGVKSGFNLDLCQAVAEAIKIPIIASGGAGSMDDFREVLSGEANGALAASVFHYDEIHITDLKEYLLNFDIPVEEI